MAMEGHIIQVRIAGHKKIKKVQASISICRAPMKIEDYRKGEPTKSKSLIIKKQKRSSLW